MSGQAIMRDNARSYSGGGATGGAAATGGGGGVAAAGGGVAATAGRGTGTGGGVAARGVGATAGSGTLSACETDNVTALELQSNKRILYFSDGVMEEMSSDSEDDAEAGDVTDKCYGIQLDEREMALGPRLRYKASRMGNRFLAGIDYVGGGLASLLGITGGKYANEMENYQRTKDHGDEDLDNWHSRPTTSTSNNNNNNRNETIVLCAPTRSEATSTLPPTRQ
ncbi:hypothetical protein KR009_000371 [Drosophila setifemur]|nr:hypothetical protein KR009_000371 [Drosophila setifemur]